ncbi:MAG TPA: hypothetical protein VFH55_04770 [Nitrospiria bacterium]|nr:hypothetical protein [Nitrospiria bacterium]
MALEQNFIIGPVASAAIEAIANGEAREIGIFGPRGEAKTTSGAVATIRHAVRHKEAGYPLPVPWAVVTDSFNSHKEKTIPSLRSLIWGGAWRFFDDNHKAVFRDNRKDTVILDLIGIEDKGAIDRVRLETVGLWVEEPAPATTGPGVPELAWLTGITSQRLPTHAKVAFFTTNYPDDDHWTWTRMSPGVGLSGRHPDNPTRLWFRIPKGENRYISEADRLEWAQALRDRPDLAKRLLEGQPGSVQLGAQVAEGFRENFHVSRERLRPVQGEPLLIGQDFGHTPATIIGQPWRGYIRVYAAIPCERGGIRQHFSNAVIPWLSSRAPWALQNRGMVVGWYDPAGDTGEETDIDESPMRLVEKLLPGTWNPGPVKWDSRNNLLLSALQRHAELGRPALQIDPVDGRPLIQALSGRWHYPEDRNGNVSRDLPKKPNHPWEDLGDGFIYFLAGVGAGPLRPDQPITVVTGFDIWSPVDPVVKVETKFDPFGQG